MSDHSSARTDLSTRTNRTARNTHATRTARPAGHTPAAHHACLTRRAFLTCAGLGSAATLAACSNASASSSDGSGQASSTPATPTGALALNMAAWNHDDTNDVWWQTGVAYCEKPATTDYETLGIYVPGAYLQGTANDDGTYTCTLAADGAAGGFTAQTAPIVIPVNTAGYSAQEAPTSYSYDAVSSYLEAGLVYVYPGCRGRDNGYNDDGTLAYSGGAPWGVTDLKAAVRYLRYNAALLPGSTERIFTFGHSGGGAQSALMGASGDSSAYTPYLESIGAALEDSAGGSISDAIAGSMCWCPITALDEGNESYEWMMGQFASSGTRAEGSWTASLSAHLAAKFADYVNGAGFKDADGNALALEQSSDGIWLAGSYYDHLVGVIEGSLNDFLSATEFPYTPSSSQMGDGGFGGGLTGGADGDKGGGAPDGSESAPSGSAPSGDAPSGSAPSGSAPSGEAPSGEAPSGEAPSGNAPSGAAPSGGGSGAPGSTDSGSSSNTTYETAADYIAALNGDNAWISYDESANTATITGLAGFIGACKPATKDVCAFDATDRSQAENTLFGNDSNDALHFDPITAELLDEHASEYAELDGWDSSLPDAWASDLAQTDALGGSMSARTAMYNPMAYLCDGYDLYQTSSVAPHWRIRTGIEQGDTSLTTEMNLALALQASGRADDVDFATIWGQGHTTAELTGSSTSNFIDWVKACVA